MKPLLFILLVALALVFAVRLLRADEPARSERAIRVACVGDSITYGARISNREAKCDPTQLGSMLGTNYSVRNFGVNGATLLKHGDIPYWRMRAFKAAQDFKPDIAVINLGANDAAPYNWIYKHEFVRDYTELIQNFKSNGCKTVWICYPAPTYPGPYDFTDPIVVNEIIPMIDEIARQTGAKIIDLYRPLSGKSELFPDTVHPNAEGARLMAKEVFSAITADGNAP
ncbi:MAG: sialate O-acetylesterase [Verrucomicrobia bacterium]|nr:sialate O-acetylesterase [Verrucomicrobiota bacterium]